MKYLILSITVFSNILLMAIDTASENPLVAELELCIQTGAYVQDLESYQEPLHHLALDKIAEIQASCEQYIQAIATANELHKNELLAGCVGLMEQPMTQEQKKLLLELPQEIRTRGRQLLWRMRGDIGPHVQRIQSIIIDLPNNESVEQYVELENERIEAIQEWLSAAKVVAENKKRAEESGTELYEQLKDKYLQQMNTQN